MSAIFGWIDFSGKAVCQSKFDTCFTMLKPYGIESAGVLLQDNLGFGQQITRIAEASAFETGPISEGRYILVADAVLDNRNELLAKLSLVGADAKLISDSQLILHAFKRWGPAFGEHVFGDYTTAIYDKENEKLFLVRDHIGTRPVYWARINNAIIFATDIRAITAIRDITWEMDEAAIGRHLMGPARPPEKTFFKGLYAVSPGSVLQLDQQTTRETRWWDPHNVTPIRYKARDAYVEHFKEILDEVGRDYTATKHPVGSHISGGIDSSAVTAFASQALNERNRNLTAAYSWAPPVNEAYPFFSKRDERHNILRIGDDLDIKVRFGQATGQSQRDYLKWPLELDGIANLSDEVPVLKSAEHDGIRVMLSGWGGDEAFSAHGMGYMSHTIKRLNWAETYRILRYQTGAKKFRPRKMARTLMDWGIAPMMPDVIYERIAPFRNLSEGGAFISKYLADQRPDLAPWLGEDIRLISDPIRYLGNLILMGHLNMRMETWAAWSSRYGFQYRYPLLDRRILEFILGLPPSLLFGDGSTRFLAKSSVKGILPDHLTKHDQANEALRDQNHVDCWRILQDELRSGTFEGSSNWLDMNAMRTAISHAPKKLEQDDLSTLAKLMAAVRIWHMEKRWS